VRSGASTVDEYIAEASEERREALNLLRRLCCEELSGFDEAMNHGMPAYLRGDVVEVGFASQRRYISLYVLREAALQANARRLDGLSVGKGCIRFRGLDQIDPGTVRAVLRATVIDTGPIC
jgi:uncharacterized protein YdhG (YjbR/CyaY superfamily)